MFTHLTQYRHDLEEAFNKQLDKIQDRIRVLMRNWHTENRLASFTAFTFVSNVLTPQEALPFAFWRTGRLGLHPKETPGLLRRPR